MYKKTLPALLIAAALIGSSFYMVSPVNAAPAVPQGNDTVQAVQQEQQIVKDYEAKFYPLREKLEAKRLQYRALANNPNADQKAIAQLSEEIASLHTQMIKLRTDTFGYHHGGRGFGPGMGGRGGHGMGMGGMGMGGCPGMSGMGMGSGMGGYGHDGGWHKGGRGMGGNW